MLAQSLNEVRTIVEVSFIVVPTLYLTLQVLKTRRAVRGL